MAVTSFQYIDYDYLKDTIHLNSTTTIPDFDDWDNDTPDVLALIEIASIVINHNVVKDGVGFVIEKHIADGTFDTYFTEQEKNAIYRATGWMCQYYLKNGYDFNRGSGSFSLGQASGNISNPINPDYIPPNVKSILASAGLLEYRQSTLGSKDAARQLIAEQVPQNDEFIFGIHPSVYDYLKIADAEKNYVQVTSSGPGGAPITNFKTDTPATVTIKPEYEDLTLKPIIKVNVHTQGQVAIHSTDDTYFYVSEDDPEVGYTMGVVLATDNNDGVLSKSYADNFYAHANEVVSSIDIGVQDWVFFNVSDSTGHVDIIAHHASDTSDGIVSKTFADTRYAKQGEIVDSLAINANSTDYLAVNTTTGNINLEAKITDETTNGLLDWDIANTVFGKIKTPVAEIGILEAQPALDDTLNAFRLQDFSGVNDALVIRYLNENDYSNTLLPVNYNIYRLYGFLTPLYAQPVCAAGGGTELVGGQGAFKTTGLTYIDSNNHQKVANMMTGSSTTTLYDNAYSETAYVSGEATYIDSYNLDISNVVKNLFNNIKYNCEKLELNTGGTNNLINLRLSLEINYQDIFVNLQNSSAVFQHVANPLSTYYNELKWNGRTGLKDFYEQILYVTSTSTPISSKIVHFPVLLDLVNQDTNDTHNPCRVSIYKTDTDTYHLTIPTTAGAGQSKFVFTDPSNPPTWAPYQALGNPASKIEFKITIFFQKNEHVI